MPGNRWRSGLWIGLIVASLLFAPAVVWAGNARVAGLSATRTHIGAASNPSGRRVQLAVTSEPSKSAKNPAGITVNIGAFDIVKKRNAADPNLWCLYE